MNSQRPAPATRLTPLLAAALLLSACAAPSLWHRRGDSATPAPSTQVDLDILNNHYNATDIYVVRYGYAALIGRVQPNSEGQFVFPANLLEANRVLRLRAKVVGSVNEVDAEPVSLAPDARHVQWVVRRNLEASRPRVN